MTNNENGNGDGFLLYDSVSLAALAETLRNDKRFEDLTLAQKVDDLRSHLSDMLEEGLWPEDVIVVEYATDAGAREFVLSLRTRATPSSWKRATFRSQASAVYIDEEGWRILVANRVIKSASDWSEPEVLRALAGF